MRVSHMTKTKSTETPKFIKSFALADALENMAKASESLMIQTAKFRAVNDRLEIFIRHNP